MVYRNDINYCWDKIKVAEAVKAPVDIFSGNILAGRTGVKLSVVVALPLTLKLWVLPLVITFVPQRTTTPTLLLLV